jgi:phosphoribosyl-AMP cyclohydrolase
MHIDKLDFSKGLIPVIVQDQSSKEILMLAYVNREALEKTLSTALAHFWSRSRGKLWKKGETSGNFIKVNEILVDCDGDTLIYLSSAGGPACHTGNKSCFFRSLDGLKEE